MYGDTYCTYTLAKHQLRAQAASPKKESTTDSSPAVSRSSTRNASLLGTGETGGLEDAGKVLPSAALLSLILIGDKRDDWGRVRINEALKINKLHF